jgi:hypothetical protein
VVSLVSVVENEVEKQEKRHPKGVQDERILGRAIESQAKGNLHNTKKGESPAGPTVEVDAERTSGNVPDQTAADGLQQNHDVNGDSDSMVRVGEVARRAYRNKAQNEYDGGEANSKNLEVGVIFDRLAGALRVESDEEDGYWDDEEERESSQYTVAEDEAVVLCKSGEAIAHSIVSHCLKVQPYEVGQEECVLGEIPCPVSDI